MENVLSESDMRNLVRELTQGKELAKQLKIHLTGSTAHETGELLLREILNSFEHSLSVIKGSRGEAAPSPGGVAADLSDSPQPLTGSFRSDDSDQEPKDQGNTDQVSRKRKDVEKWTQRVEVCPGKGIEGQLDDGYSWRKYGQKEIQGTKHPRGYYRCTYRHVQGCMATKQIQRSNDDPNVFEITFKGLHTCNPNGNSSTCNPSIPMIDSQSEENSISSSQNPHQSENQHEPLINIQTSLRVLTSQDSCTNMSHLNFPSSSNFNQDKNNFFSNDDEFLANYLPNLPIPSSAMNNNHGGLFHSLHTTESELNRVVSATTSANTSTILGVDFPFGIPSKFGPNFSFDNERKFP